MTEPEKSIIVCPIVGIGASVDDPMALKKLFDGLPADTGAAFVVVHHLARAHETLTAEILARSTTMPIVQMAEDVRVQPNHIYIIPSNTYLVLNDNIFELKKSVLQRGLCMPIDSLLLSLAEQGEDHVIAIIVSGIASDGVKTPIEVSLSSTRASDSSAVSAAIREISERKRAEEKLLAAKAIAESALAAKSRFLANASHDLRQPLQSLSLLNKALLKSADDPALLDMLAMQADSLDGMKQLLNSLLDISKLESGAVKANKSDIKLQPILQRIKNEFGVLAREKGLELVVEKTDFAVQSDSGLLSRLIQNLVANAIRYTEKGFVKLTCAADQNGVRLDVTDSGIGISEDEQVAIFDEFHQANRDPQMRGTGLGLGLSIVQRIADLLGATVELESMLGNGSTFSIILPLATAELNDVSDDELVEQPELAINGGAVLLVDDDLAVLGAARLVLEMEQNFEVMVASSPGEAYAAMDKVTPDLVISDFHLGDKDTGIDVIEMARQQSGLDIPGILVTGDTSPEIDQVRCDNVKIMTKPIDADKLISLAHQLLAKPPRPASKAK